MKTMTMNTEFARTSEYAAEYRNADSPFVSEFFLVQGTDYRCMAYRDSHGKWRAAFSHSEVPGSVRVLV